MDASSLATFWAALIGFSILVYVLLDGFDLGIGILFGLTRDEEDRRMMMSAIAPFWDGNETWLVLVGASLFGAFPMVYAIFLPAFYLPITLLLFALIFRGVAFEFRYRSERLRPLWDWGFALGSTVVAFVQGAAIGTMVQELPVVNGRYAGGSFEWITVFSIICGVGLVLAYALLGAGWLMLKTEGPVHERARRQMGWLLAGVLVFVVLAFAFAANLHLRIADRWSEQPALLAFPVVILLAAAMIFASLRRRGGDGVPFVGTVVIMVAAYLMLVASFWPYMIPYSVTIEAAAAPKESLSFMFWGAGLIVFPVVLIYTIVVYWVFRGKTVKISRY